MKVRAWNDRAALVRHGCAVLVVACTAGIIYATLDFRVKASEEKGLKNEAQIEAVKDKINKIEVQQQVIITNQNNDQRNQAEFRVRTESALESILKKLDRAERRETDRQVR